MQPDREPLSWAGLAETCDLTLELGVLISNWSPPTGDRTPAEGGTPQTTYRIRGWSPAFRRSDTSKTMFHCIAGRAAPWCMTSPTIGPNAKSHPRRTGQRHGSIAAVDGASFELRPGEMTYVLGPGRGKTTWHGCWPAGTLDDGEIYFGDRMVQALAPHERALGWFSRTWGLARPDRDGECRLSAEGPKVARPNDGTGRRDADHARIDSLAGRRPDQLSPPQRFRTALARAW